jgi:hypothetical protein
VRPSLAKGEVAAEDHEPGFGESTGHQRKQARTAVSACSVREYQAISIPFRRNMEKASHMRLARRVSK